MVISDLPAVAPVKPQSVRRLAKGLPLNIERFDKLSPNGEFMCPRGSGLARDTTVAFAGRAPEGADWVAFPGCARKIILESSDAPSGVFN